MNIKNLTPNGCGGGGSNSSSEPIKIKELHGCMGLNACKGHDRFGTNECAGTGYCATNQHYCHTMNDCRNQGGCGLYGTAKEQCEPGINRCSGQGSCGTPIPAERFSTQGPNQGKSVWLLARKLFEQRMTDDNPETGTRRTIGPSPYETGPPLEWLTAQGNSESCGISGSKKCSYGFNNANVTVNERIQRSIDEMPETVEGCDCVKPFKPNEDAALDNHCSTDAE